MTAEPTAPPADEFPEEMDAPLPPPGPGEMTILDHLKELRNRVFVAMLAIIIGCIVCFIFWSTILDFLLEPARADLGQDFKLASFSPTDRIFAIFKVGMYGGIIVASPVVLYEIMAFVVPGLTSRERRLLLSGMGGAIVFLIGGMAFAYYIILPQSLGFLLDLASDQTENVIGIQQYMDFVLRIVFWVGLSFELPMVIALAAKLGMINAKQLLGFWRYAILLVFILAAIVTPTPDPVTQTFVAGPLLVLYAVGILFAWILYTPRDFSARAPDDEDQPAPPADE